MGAFECERIRRIALYLRNFTSAVILIFLYLTDTGYMFLDGCDFNLKVHGSSAEI